MRHIKLVLDNQTFKNLEDKKQQKEKQQKEKISWEDFVFSSVCGK
jgi:hypothetical protein